MDEREMNRVTEGAAAPEGAVSSDIKETEAGAAGRAASGMSAGGATDVAAGVTGTAGGAAAGLSTDAASRAAGMSTGAAGVAADVTSVGVTGAAGTAGAGTDEAAGVTDVAANSDLGSGGMDPNWSFGISRDRSGERGAGAGLAGAPGDAAETGSDAASLQEAPAENGAGVESGEAAAESAEAGAGTGSGSTGAAEKKKSGAAKKFMAACLIVALCGGAGFGGAYGAIKMSGADKAANTTVTISGDTDSLNAASAIAEKTMPSVVGITTTTQTLTETIFGLQQGTSTGIGTGVIVDEDGYILTNAHVVEGSTDSYATGNPQVTVDLYDGTTYEGEVVWSDTGIDLAVIKIDATGLQAAALGDSDKVEIGDYAIAIGNPLGMNLERSVTQGIISGLNRTIIAANGSQRNTMQGMIQTDAAINGGNSGGPLINSEGEVIGINTAGASSSGADGLGFAIPINTAKTVIDQIKSTGSYEQPYMGIAGIDVETVLGKYADQVNLKTTKGVYLAQIYTGTGAAKAGLKEGDVITAIDGKDVANMSSMKSILMNYKPGDTIKLTIERDQKEMEVELTLGSSSDQTTAITTNSSDGSNGLRIGSGSGSSTGSGIGSGSGGLGGIFGN
ncbi:MAG: trypsin-like peptidase domain-containing protein [Clostridia bacterium]|nr:trypsin-like peptidase domain-containing protein [Clostridia bacterium]